MPGGWRRSDRGGAWPCCWRAWRCCGGARGEPLPALLQWAGASAVLLVVVQVGFVRAALPSYDLHPLAQHLRRVELQGTPVAHLGKYHGQYQFLGRLQAPLAVLSSHAQALDWARAHPRGKLVIYYPDWRPGTTHDVEFAQGFRGKGVAVLGAAQVARHPEWLQHWPPRDVTGNRRDAAGAGP